MSPRGTRRRRGIRARDGTGDGRRDDRESEVQEMSSLRYVRRDERPRRWLRRLQWLHLARGGPTPLAGQLADDDRRLPVVATSPAHSADAGSSPRSATLDGGQHGALAESQQQHGRVAGREDRRQGDRGQRGGTLGQAGRPVCVKWLTTGDSSTRLLRRPYHPEDPASARQRHDRRAKPAKPAPRGSDNTHRCPRPAQPASVHPRELARKRVTSVVHSSAIGPRRPCSTRCCKSTGRPSCASWSPPPSHPCCPRLWFQRWRHSSAAAFWGTDSFWRNATTAVGAGPSRSRVSGADFAQVALGDECAISPRA